jgi:molybdate transport system substrate-binding protein
MFWQTHRKGEAQLFRKTHRHARAGRAAMAALAMMLASPAWGDTITVFGAASLKSALTEIGAQWAKVSGHEIVFSFAGSSALARQIQQGAPADIFIPASQDWMTAVIASGDMNAPSRRDILGNSLVLIAPAPAGPSAQIGADFDLAGRLAGGKLAMALVDAVPAGIYGQQALTSLGLWDSVLDQIVQADSVTGALNFVVTGEAALGIVYASDAKGIAGVQVIGTFAPSSHDPITYPAALSREAKPAAAEFLDFLTSPQAKEIWHGAGFAVLK